MQPVGGGMLYAPGGSSLNWANCLFFLGAEQNDTTGTYDISTGEYSAGDQSGAYTDEGLTITATGPLAGTYSFVTGGYGGMTFDVTAMDIAPTQAGSIAFWRNFTALPTGSEVFSFDGAGDTYYVQISSGGEITFRVFEDGVGFQTWVSSDAGLTTGNDYFIEVLFDGSAGTCSMYRNNTALSVSGGGTFGALTGFTAFNIPDHNNEAGEGKMDNIMIFNTSMRLWDYRSAAYGD